MNTKERREAIKNKIMESEKPISATALAKIFHVSRQIVVGDVAILRASQEAILATPRGYIYDHKDEENTYVIACIHTQKDTQEELNIIVDAGGYVEDVIIHHAVYGELSGKLHIASRMDVEEFISLCKEKKAKNLSDLSEGVHFHTIKVPNEKVYNSILEKLKEKGFLYEKN